MIGSQSILNTIVHAEDLEDDWYNREKRKVVFYEFYTLYYDNLAEKIREKDCFKMYHFCSHVKKSGLDMVHADSYVKSGTVHHNMIIYYDGGIKYCLNNIINHWGIYKASLEKIEGEYIESIEYYTSTKLLVKYFMDECDCILKEISMNGKVFDPVEIGNFVRLAHIMVFYKEFTEGTYNIEDIDVEDKYNDVEIITMVSDTISENIIELTIAVRWKKLGFKTYTDVIMVINGDSTFLIIVDKLDVKSFLAIVDINNKKINIVKIYYKYRYGFEFGHILWNGEVVPLIIDYGENGTNYYVFDKDNSLKKINVNDIIYAWFAGSKDGWNFIFYDVKYYNNYRVLYKYDELFAPRFLKVITHKDNPYTLEPYLLMSLINNKIIYLDDSKDTKILFKYILSHPTTQI